MFERYTEKARRVIFFARYEASTLGSPEIQPEHLLLGLLRENRSLLHPPRAKDGSREVIQRRIAENLPGGERKKISTSVDLPLSAVAHRILDQARIEAGALGHTHIGTEHLLLGLLLEPETFAAKLLTEQGLTISSLRDELRTAGNGDAPQRASDDLPFTEESRNALRLAREEAKVLGLPAIGTDHLLLGILRSDPSAAKLFSAMGLTPENLREKLRRHHGGTETKGGSQ